MKYRPKTKPFPHQTRATLRAVRAKNYGIFFEPRLGKSKAALDVAGIWAMKRRKLRVLILGPRIALQVWEGQIDQHYPHRWRCESFDEVWASDDNPFRTRFFTEFFLAGREETFVRRGGKVGPKAKEVEAWDPDLIIVDESHEYKRPGGRGASDLWRMVRRLRKRRASSGLPYVLLLSGTPNPKGWRDLFAQFRIMDEAIFGTNAAEFDNRHVVRGVGPRRWTIIKYNREKELIRKIREHSYSVSADEAGMANETFFESLKVQLPERVVKMYLELAEEFLVQWEGGVISAKNAGVKRLRLLQLTGGYTTDGSEIHRAKVEALKAYLALLLEQGESVVVYARFTPEVGACTRVAENVGYRTFRVDGSTKTQDRSRAIATLAKTPSIPTALVFQYQAGSRAIELVGAAETVFYGVPDGWVDYWQCLKRTQGPNQQRPVRYTHLVCPGTVDVAAFQGLRRKEDFHQTMMRNPRRYLTGMI